MNSINQSGGVVNVERGVSLLSDGGSKVAPLISTAIPGAQGRVVSHLLAVLLDPIIVAKTPDVL
jgi:hypothetical protein